MTGRKISRKRHIRNFVPLQDVFSAHFRCGTSAKLKSTKKARIQSIDPFTKSGNNHPAREQYILLHEAGAPMGGRKLGNCTCARAFRNSNT